MATPPKKRKKTSIFVASDSTPSDDQATEENPATAIITVSAVELPELTEAEQSDRLHLERRVERAFFEAGKALAELRNRKLYRSTHDTFEEYCKDRFGFERRHPYRLIEASIVFDNLMKMCPNGTQNETQSNDGQMCPNETQTEKELDNEQICPNWLQILPTSERQVRPLTKLEPDKQQEVWRKAVVEAAGKVPSARIVQSVVDKNRDSTQVPNPYRLGEICIIQPKDNPDLRGKSGYWGVVTHLGEFSCTVQSWDGDYTVRISQLKSLELLDEDCLFMQQLCMRLRRLHSVAGRDEAVDWLLQGLGKQSKSYLTALQAKLLAAMEREYGLPPL